MDKMKKFLKYIIALILLFVFSNFIINALLNNSYTKIKKYEINVSELYVDVTEAKASTWSGSIKGIVKNNTEQVVENKYLRVSMLSKNGRILGEKYIKIDKLESGQVRDFEVKFECNNVKSFRIEYTETMPEGVTFIELIKQNAKDIGNDIRNNRIEL
jgi:hypothetical protein